MAFWAAIFALGAGLNILRGWRMWPGVFAGNLNDPDSYMRLLRLGQGIAHGHLTNVVAGVQSGAPVIVEWSRLYDVLLWLMALPLAPVLGWHASLFWAGVASGPLAVGGLGLALAFAARPFAEDRLLWTAPVAAALLPGLATVAAPGVVHYHSALLAMIAITAGCTARAWRLAAGGSRIGWAFLSGMAAGFAIWLTPETMPFVLAALATLLARFWLRPDPGILMNAAAGMFDVLGFGLFIDPPVAGYLAPEIDRLSCVYVILPLALMAIASMLNRRQRQGRTRRIREVGTVLVALVVLAWIAVFPGLVMGPYGVLPPTDGSRFFGVMQELQPVRGLGGLVVFLLPGLLALAYALHRTLRGDGPARAAWAWFAAWVLIAIVLGYRFVLFAGFSSAAAAAILPIALSEARQRFAARPPRAIIAQLGVAVLLILPPQLPVLAASHRPASGPSCSLRRIGALLAPFPHAVVLAPVEATPEILYRSHAYTVGGLYQHGIPGFLNLYAAWRAPAATLSPAIGAASISLVLACRTTTPYAIVAGAPPGNLWDALQQGHPPAWLTPVGGPAATPDGWRLYKVGPQA